MITLVTRLSIFSIWEQGYCKTVEVALSERHRWIPLVFREKKKKWEITSFFGIKLPCREIEDQH